MLEVGEYFVGLNTDMFLGILDYALDRNKKTRFFKVIGSPKSQQPTPPKEVKESDLYD